MNPTRRNILRAGAASLALPLLDFGRSAKADQPAVPTRFVVFVTAQGNLNRYNDMDFWTPPAISGGGLDVSSKPVLSMLAPHQDKMVVLRGVDNVVRELYAQGDGHSGTALATLTAALPETAVNASGQYIARDQQAIVNVYTTRSTGPSIDHYVASKFGSPAPVNMSLLDYGMNSDMFHRVTKDPDGFSSRGDPVVDPVNVFNQFIGRTGSASLTRLDRIKSKRHSVLDAVGSSFSDLYSRVGAEDKQRLQQHAQRISEMEASLGSDTMLACESPSQVLPSTYPPDGTQWWLKYNWENGVWTAQIDNLVQMLSCGVRRVATLNNENGHGPEMPWLATDPDTSPADRGNYPISTNTGGDWHGHVHGNTNNPVLIEGYRYYGRQFKYLLDRMDAIVEPNGKTLLDNSLVLWISEMGHAGAHDSNNLPVILAGGAQGALRTGRYINVSRDNQPVRYTTGDLHTSILKILGYNETFGYTGDSSLNHGGIPGLA